jgi:hypothetical protein
MSKIKTGEILDRLSRHLAGDVELTQTQIRAAEILLRRSFPEITQQLIEQKVTHEFNGDPASLSNAQLAAIVSRASGGDAAGAEEGTPTSH